MLQYVILALFFSSCIGFQFSGPTIFLKQSSHHGNQFRPLFMAGFGNKAIEEQVVSNVVPSGESLCLCDSKKKYSDCCQLLHDSTDTQQDVEVDATKVARARFTALRSELMSLKMMNLPGQDRKEQSDRYGKERLKGFQKLGNSKI
jgi:hypothetical protein